MTSYKTVQEIIVHRGRRFHFVSYEGRRPDHERNQEGRPACWYLMAAGKRVLVMEQVIGVEQGELQRQLTDWLNRNVFVAEERPASITPAPSHAAMSGGRLRRRP